MLRVKDANPNNPSKARLAAGRRVCRKYRNAYIRNLQQQEYDKLRSIVPSLASRRRANRIPKVTVIEETIRYIDQLHKALADRVLSKTDDSEPEVNENTIITDTMERFIEDKATSTPATNGASNFAVCERDRRHPSYVIRSDVLSRLSTSGHVWQ